MSLPPIDPTKTAAGIALDPQTLERVIPESKRPDGSVRKQIKIRPGFTPQEDVRRFRGTKQTQADANQLPKGHIIGWAPPPTSTASNSTGKALSKNAKKRAKKREKKEEEPVADNWEDDDEAPSPPAAPRESSHTTASSDNDGSALASKLDKLNVK
ncbi:hypothetical protein FB45DRAFT_1000893 [Roridomyces roridus]|uniref:WIBG Mago-binding domain-containing protein n=1 Tax=Roridomyces roridus TaxID=1738132 RepID=A0AAD7C4J3_9AGAR|nr:hypothetical protein FB45DRAFT_1000893 [Roridomyces roridus]